MSMIINFYLVDNKLDIDKDTPWKTIVPPSGVEPSIYFFEDAQCELISEDEVAIFFEDGEAIFYKDQNNKSIEPEEIALWLI